MNLSHRSFLIPTVAMATVGLLSALPIQRAQAQEFVSGTYGTVFANPVGGENNQIINLTDEDDNITSTIFKTGSPVGSESRYTFKANSDVYGQVGDLFSVGGLTFNNKINTVGSTATAVDLRLQLNVIMNGYSVDINDFLLTLTNTPNATGTSTGDSDGVTFTNPNPRAIFNAGGVDYVFDLVDFKLGAGVTNADIRNNGTSFFVAEGQTATAALRGRITVVPEPGEWATYLIMAGSLGTVAFRARVRRSKANNAA